MAALQGGGEPGGARFDASQYAFFGNDVVEEVELGGLEDEEDKSSNIGISEIDEEFQPSYPGDKFEGRLPYSDVDDLASTFSKLNRAISEPMHPGMDTRAKSFPHESAIPAEWSHEAGYNQTWSDQQLFDTDQALVDAGNDQQRWWSQPHHASSSNMSRIGDPKPLQRTASYPQKEPQHFPTEPIPIPNRHPGFNPQPSAPPFSLSGLMPHGPLPVQYHGSPNFTPPGLAIHPNLIQHQRPSPPMNPSVVPPQMQHLMQSQMYMRPHHSPPHQILNRVEMASSPDLADPRFRPGYRIRPNHHTRFDNNMGWQQPRYCSRYMTIDEIEHISRMQHALAHGSDPYIDDYYHQACLSKKTAGSGLRHHFCPSSIRDPSTCTRSRDEPHAFLQVEALGRLPFSSIRRPRPLLDVDPASSSSDTKPVMPLDQEPMLAARITIEDGLCLVLDVDDIDRVLQFNQLPDGGSHLRRKRQALLDEIVSSLHLVDPLAPVTGSGTSTGNDDLVFLRIVSLPKGRKLLSRYLNLLHTGTGANEVTRVVCMAMFRHLRFLFGSMPADSSVAASTKSLAFSLCNCVFGMDLSSLSACLAAVVCSNEQPPLRPIGSPAGDGASLALKAVLERAAELLKNNSADLTSPNRVLWQASFDAFFVLLTKYCTGKYDSIVRNGAGIVLEEVARAISREMPVELLRASLPHTNEAQRKYLVDFAQRSLPVSGHAHGGSDNGPVSSASVPS